MNKKVLIVLSMSMFVFSGCATWNPFSPNFGASSCKTELITCDTDYAKVAKDRNNGRYVSSDGKVGYEEGTYQVDDNNLHVGVWYKR